LSQKISEAINLTVAQLRHFEVGQHVRDSSCHGEMPFFALSGAVRVDSVSLLYVRCSISCRLQFLVAYGLPILVILPVSYTYRSLRVYSSIL